VIPFWAEALPYAKQAHAATGVLTSVILAQWADETGFGGPDWQPPRNNPGNVGNTEEAGQMDYPTLADGVAGYIDTMNLPDYARVRAAQGWEAQALALGQSPWAAGRYGNPPGSDLIAIIQADDLTQYDAPPQPPTEQENPTVTSLVVNNQIHVWAVIGTTAYHWWQQIGETKPTWGVEALPAS
jgi:flagellum-specific peptidoglycan hydrolase FlgJ